MAKYAPKTRVELQELIKNESINLGDIDVSGITDMSNLFYEDEEKTEIIKALRKYKPQSILILGTSDGMVQKIAANLGLPEISETIYITDVATEAEMKTARRISPELNQTLRFCIY